MPFHRSLGLPGFLGLLIVVGVTAAPFPSTLRAETTSLAKLLPAGSAIVVELTDGRALLSGLDDSGLTKRVLGSQAYRDFEASKDGKQLQQLLRVLENQSALSTRKLLEHVLGGRSALSVQFGDGGGPRLLIASHLAEPATFQKLLDVALLFAGEAGSSRKTESVTRFRLGDVRGCLQGKLLLLSQEQALLEEALRRQAPGEGSGTGIASDERFEKMQQSFAADSQLRVYVDVDQLRTRRPGLRRWIEPRPNAGESLFFGGYQRAFAQCNDVIAELAVAAGGITLRAQTDAGKIPTTHSCFFPPTPQLPPLEGVGQIGRLTVQRQPLDWWQAQESLVTEAVRLQMQRFQTDLGNLLGGADFDEQILPFVGSEAQLLFFQPTLLASKDEDEKPVRPEPLLPEMALVLPCADKPEFADQLRVSFQTLVGFLNLERMQNQERPLMLGSEEHGGFTISFARPLPPRDEAPTGIEYNFALSFAVEGERLIIGSNLQATKRAVDALKRGGKRAKARGDALWVDSAQLARILAENRTALIAQGILEGKSAAEAAAEQREVQELLSWFRDARIELHRRDERLQLAATLAMAPEMKKREESAPEKPDKKPANGGTRQGKF